jgi:L-alanine-DL-glutamate epimerase-like enolase superfamily enzyme
VIGAHFCATIPNFAVMEIDIDSAPWRDELVTTPPTLESGDFIVPTAPGWGCDIDERGVARHPPRL